MAQRKAIGKKLRFEVFKRDSFTCQYCGKSAPDVILEVDHINSVKNGGENNIMNLITSCRDCNRGKGPGELSDRAMLKAEMKKLQDINERRNQMKLMFEWREELANLEEEAVNAFDKEIKSKLGATLTERGRDKASAEIKKHGLSNILGAFDISYSKYYRGDNAPSIIELTYKICLNRLKDINDPFHKDRMYIWGILRNRFDPRKQEVSEIMAYLQRNCRDDDDVEFMTYEAKRCGSLYEFFKDMDETYGGRK